MRSKVSHQAPCFDLEERDIQALPRVKLLGHRDRCEELLVYVLPDRVRAAFQRAAFDQTETPRTVRVYGLHAGELNAEAIVSRRVCISIDDDEFFMPAKWLPEGSPLQAVVLWVQVDLSTALGELGALAGVADGEQPTTGVGLIANLLRGPRFAAGLYSLAELDEQRPLPGLRPVADLAAPFPPLESVLHHTEEIPLLRFLLAEERPFVEDLITRFEQLVLEQRYEEAREHLLRYEQLWQLDVRAEFAAGQLFLRQRLPAEAAEHFHQAQLLAHPDALKSEWACQRKLGEPLRRAHPEIFSLIRRGARAEALPLLRAELDRFPESVPAILSYCVRGIASPEEGLEMCERALVRNPNQSDVLANKWRFLIDCGAADDGLDCALSQGRRYPQELIGARNLVDSLLLSGNHAAAAVQVDRYAVLSTNLGLVAKQLFRVYEQTGDWHRLLARLDRILVCNPRPSIATLTLLGETLIETGDFDRCAEVFERALTLEPGNSKVVLGYARALARSEKEVEAECLLATALADPDRIDRFEDRLFLMTLLAEIQRRTGRPETAFESLAELREHDILVTARKAGPIPGIELAEVYLALGRAEEAREIIARLALEFGDDPFVAEMVAIAA